MMQEYSFLNRGNGETVIDQEEPQACDWQLGLYNTMFLNNREILETDSWIYSVTVLVWKQQTYRQASFYTQAFLL